MSGPVSIVHFWTNTWIDWLINYSEINSFYSPTTNRWVTINQSLLPLSDLLTFIKVPCNVFHSNPHVQSKVADQLYFSNTLWNLPALSRKRELAFPSGKTTNSVGLCSINIIRQPDTAPLQPDTSALASSHSTCAAAFTQQMIYHFGGTAILQNHHHFPGHISSKSDLQLFDVHCIQSRVWWLTILLKHHVVCSKFKLFSSRGSAATCS